MEDQNGGTVNVWGSVEDYRARWCGMVYCYGTKLCGTVVLIQHYCTLGW